MDRRGALTKRGSVWLRTTLVESAQIAVRRSNQFRNLSPGEFLPQTHRRHHRHRQAPG